MATHLTIRSCLGLGVLAGPTVFASACLPGFASHSSSEDAGGAQPDGAMADGQAPDAAADGSGDAGSIAEAASDALSDAGSDASDSSASCQSGATRCVFNGVQTCSYGTWGSLIACPADSPNCSSGVCGQPPSCQVSTNGTTNCGADGGGSESCCASLEVDGGTYDRTYTNSGTGATGQADLASISGFRLDKYLVTVGRFRQFVAAWNNGSGYLPAPGSGKHVHLNGGEGLMSAGATGADGGFVYESGWDSTDWNNTTDIDPTDGNLESCSPYATWTDPAGPQENRPINCVTWWEAAAFCIWDGGFLPSEAEWEYVAAGGSEEFEYPWGSFVTPGSVCPGTGCEYAIYNCAYPSGPGSCTGVTNIAPVGTASLGAGLWGQLDMAGDVYEWNLDGYGSSYVDPCTDCAYLTSTTDRMLRGGYFMSPAESLVPTFRYVSQPGYRNDGSGVRCARTP